MNKVSSYAFYGSLRRGMFNFEIYKDHLEFISKNCLPGFKLFALPNYPVAIKTNNSKDLLIVELYKITNPATENKIHRMEIDAGYYLDIIEVEESKTGIYLCHEQGSLPEIKHGDWVKYFESKGQFS